MAVHGSFNKVWKPVLVSASAILVVVALAGVFLLWHWPFSREAVLKDLEEASTSKVHMDAFHGTYFPRPGCELTHVTFQHNPKAGTLPLITIETVRIEGTLWGVFTRHLRRIRADGLHILIPSRDSGEQFEAPKRSTFVIDDFMADGATAEVESREPEARSLKLLFRTLVISNVGSKGPASFRTQLSNSKLPGEITSTGTFGPWNPDDLGKVTVSGDYLFEHADLNVVPGIAGLLSSSGKFSGTLDHIEIQGVTDTPSFAVTSSSHRVQLKTQFHVVVNGVNGDTFLQQVGGTFWKTTVWWQGSVAGTTAQPGKVASIELDATDGRIQDLLLLFARSERSPMSGNVSFHAKVCVTPGKRSFLERVELQGTFGIDAGTFSRSSTQEGVNHLSAGASRDDTVRKPVGEQGEPETVLSDLRGQVLLRDGTARFSNLSFTVPGALAQMDGTYSLITERIDLHGMLKTDSAPSNTTHGIKSLLMKAVDPFFKKKRAGYAIPVKVTGTYEHPVFGLDLGRKGDQRKEKEQSRASQLLDGTKH